MDSPPPDRIRLLVADDHTVLRKGLCMLLEAEPDMEVVGQASGGAEAVQLAEDLRPDVVLMDITMGDMGGIEATRQIRRRLSETRVLVLTMHDDEEYLQQMLEAGATGYVLKRAADTELAVAIRAVHAGEIYLYATFSRILLRDLLRRKGAPEETPDPDEMLSQREGEVLRLVALGHTNRQIAERLYISVKTVETYRSRVMAKLNLPSRAALVRYALQEGLLDDELGQKLRRTGGQG